MTRPLVTIFALASAVASSGISPTYLHNTTSTLAIRRDTGYAPLPIAAIDPLSSSITHYPAAVQRIVENAIWDEITFTKENALNNTLASPITLAPGAERAVGIASILGTDLTVGGTPALEGALVTQWAALMLVGTVIAERAVEDIRTPKERPSGTRALPSEGKAAGRTAVDTTIEKRGSPMREARKTASEKAAEKRAARDMKKTANSSLETNIDSPWIESIIPQRYTEVGAPAPAPTAPALAPAVVAMAGATREHTTESTPTPEPAAPALAPAVVAMAGATIAGTGAAILALAPLEIPAPILEDDNETVIGDAIEITELEDEAVAGTGATREYATESAPTPAPAPAAPAPTLEHADAATATPIPVSPTIWSRLMEMLRSIRFINSIMEGIFNYNPPSAQQRLGSTALQTTSHYLAVGASILTIPGQLYIVPLETPFLIFDLFRGSQLSTEQNLSSTALSNTERPPASGVAVEVGTAVHNPMGSTLPTPSEPTRLPS